MLSRMVPSSPPDMRTLHLLKLPDILLANDNRPTVSYWLMNIPHASGLGDAAQFAGLAAQDSFHSAPSRLNSEWTDRKMSNRDTGRKRARVSWCDYPGPRPSTCLFRRTFASNYLSLAHNHFRVVLHPRLSQSGIGLNAGAKS